MIRTIICAWRHCKPAEHSSIVLQANDVDGELHALRDGGDDGDDDDDGDDNDEAAAVVEKTRFRRFAKARLIAQACRQQRAAIAATLVVALARWPSTDA